MKNKQDIALIKYIAAIIAIISMSTILSFFILAFLNNGNAPDAAEIVKLVIPSSLSGLFGFAAGGSMNRDGNDSDS